jgi:hypothetical protein
MSSLFWRRCISISSLSWRFEIIIIFPRVGWCEEKFGHLASPVMYMYMYICMYRYIYIHTHIHTCVYIYTCVCVHPSEIKGVKTMATVTYAAEDIVRLLRATSDRASTGRYHPGIGRWNMVGSTVKDRYQPSRSTIWLFNIAMENPL